MKIWLMRHPPVAVPKGQCYGQTDVALAPGFEPLVDRVKPLLPEIDGLQVRSSDLSRCHIPAAYLASEVTLDRRLRELDFGSWEGMSWSDIARADLDHWAQNQDDAKPHGGESCGEMLVRIQAFWEELKHRDEDHLLITHSGWIRLLLAHILGISITQAFRLHVDFCGLSHITVNGEWIQVVYINR